MSIYYIYYKQQNITKKSVMFKFKFVYVEKQLFMAASMNSNKNGSFMLDVQQTFIK